MSTEPSSTSSTPVRRAQLSGGRDTSFGFDLGARQALARGEPASVDRLLDECLGRVYGYLARMVRDRHVAEDLTQETLLRVLRGLTTYRPALALRPWIFTVASNVLRDHFAAQRGIAFDLATLPEGRAELAAPSDAPDAAAQISERARAAFEALQGLSDQARAVLVLRHYEGLTYAEIAAVLRIKEATARQRYQRALLRIRGRLAAFDPRHGARP